MHFWLGGWAHWLGGATRACWVHLRLGGSKVYLRACRVHSWLGGSRMHLRASSVHFWLGGRKAEGLLGVLLDGAVRKCS